MNNKSQMEITNLMFMHLVGMIGIILFTLLFISLMTGSQTRASALKEETVYYNYARRLITSTDCLAYEYIETYYDGQNSQIKSFSKPIPGLVDMSKLFDFNHLNCIRYDFVSGAISNDPKNNKQPFPVLIYEISVLDTELDKEYSFVSTAFKSKGAGQLKQICYAGQAISGYPEGCLIDCQDVRDYKILNDSFRFEGSSMEGLKNSNIPIPSSANPGVNCWEEGFNDAARAVVPYFGLNCSNIKKGFLDEYDYGNVFETSNQYFSKLRYTLKDNSFVDHNGIINIKFCVINIPTMCDPYFEGTEMPDALNALISSMGINTGAIYDEQTCKDLELPLI
ncbi:MAG: hypothetical protein WC376_04485 [Candidatus Nanoarchaeia archaeon]|jgi:hypothetical protein